MKKPWSISTTVRNPDRIRSFLEVLNDFEGIEFDEKQQVKFQITLIKRKLYKPNGLSPNLESYYLSPKNMTDKEANEIFEHMKEELDLTP